MPKIHFELWNALFAFTTLKIIFMLIDIQYLNNSIKNNKIYKLQKQTRKQKYMRNINT